FVYNAILNRKERGVRETYHEAPALTGDQVDAALAGLEHAREQERSTAARESLQAWGTRLDLALAERVNA
ncbi:MAG: hypothetical protein KC431_14530, partial [Myxococcales bacterium]|nr:hypothetical protein [Myxococcales bacterium]